MTDYMVDIETLGTDADAAIISIGACAFDPYGMDVGETFYRTITIRSNRDANRAINPETIEWWMQQSSESLAELFVAPRMKIRQALQEFMIFLGNDEPKLWSNGPTFDEIILRDAFTSQRLTFPVHYRDSRCVRTANAYLKHRGIAKPAFGGIKHNALDDAIYQARCVQLSYQMPLVVNNVVAGKRERRRWFGR